MFRFFFSDMRRNLTKIFCLSFGMAIGFLLVAKIYFQQTYDVFLPDSDRLYVATECIVQNGEYKEYNQTPGAIAPGLKKYAPQVEASTRATLATRSTQLINDEGSAVDIDGVMFADSCFFDVLKTKILEGNPHDALTVTDHCMIPRSIAEKLGGNVVGKQIGIKDFADYKATIAGVYEDFPLNSSVNNMVYLSLSTISKFSFDGRNNWVGNDRYISYFRLAEGSNTEDIKPAIRKMLEDNVDREILDVWHFNIGAKPLVGINAGSDKSKLIILLAIIILLSAGVNYLLIVIGQVNKRCKEMAIRKCYGTSDRKIFRLVVFESLFPLIISAAIALVLELCFGEFCRRLLGFTPAQLFATRHIWLVEMGVCALLFILTGIIPAWIYCRTPVTHAFRGNIRSRKGWKLAMLAVQFFASGMVLCLLVLVMRQYRMMGNLDMGFDYKNIGIVELYGVPHEKINPVIQELKKLGCVESVSSADEYFCSNASGNNVWTEGHKLHQENVADLYFAEASIFDVLGIEFVQGGTFHATNDTTTFQVIVEERFIDIMQKNFGEKDPNIIGKTFHITEHGGEHVEYTICGVVENMRRGGYEEEMTDKRAAVIFPAFVNCRNVYVRFKVMNQESLKAAQQVINRIFPNEERYIYAYSNMIDIYTEPTKRFGEAVMVVGVAILLIALIGLVGYTSDEVQRRRKEIAIMKVSGTTDSKILRLFCFDIMKVALPAMALGGVASIVVGNEWLSRFTDKVSLSPEYSVLCIVTLALIISIVATLNIVKVVRTNPVEYLREE